MFFRRHSTIRFQLTSLVVACVLPVWLLGVVLVYQEYSSKLREEKKDMLERTRAMAKEVDRELNGVQAALGGLATSPSFRDGDFKEIHRQAWQLLKSYPGADIIVADRTGQQLVNSFRPYGSPLPRRNNPTIVSRIFATGKPVISDLFFGAITKRPLIAIDIPVFKDGEVAYDLSMTFSSDVMAALLSRQHVPQGWYSTIFDSKGTVVARTRARHLVGTKTTPLFRKAVAAAVEGTVEGTNLEGIPVVVTFDRSSFSGWGVAVGVPKATVMRGIYLWMAWVIGGATIISLTGLCLAMRIGRRIARSINSLVDPALTIGRGEKVTAIGFQGVKETEEVGKALMQASALLQKHKDAASQYTKQLMGMEEDLRKRIAQELHDDIGQELTALSLNISLVNTCLPQDAEELHSRLADASLLTKGINRKVRTLMTELRPPQMEEYGLAAALRSHTEIYSNRTGLVVDFHADDHLPRLDQHKEIALFRIAQEALINIAKHAQATCAEVFLLNEESVLRLMISDNGKGFLTHPGTSGWGLTIMRERAELIGGTFRLDSALSAGTTISVELAP